MLRGLHADNNLPAGDEDTGICPSCNGNGKYSRRNEDGDFESLEIVICEACEGTGYQKEDGDVD